MLEMADRGRPAPEERRAGSPARKDGTDAPPARIIPSKLQKMYDKIPGIRCKGLCYEACGPIIVSAAENKMIRAYCNSRGIAYMPLALSIAESMARVRATGCLACPHLNEAKRCNIYPVRPAICRMFGVAESMPCPWGCEADGKMTDSASHKMLRRLMGRI